MTAPARDSGLARERTWLAWRRTILLAGVVAVLVARMAAVEGALLPVGLAIGGWTALFAVALRRHRSRRAEPGSALTLSALLTAGYAALGALLVLIR